MGQQGQGSSANPGQTAHGGSCQRRRSSFRRDGARLANITRSCPILERETVRSVGSLQSSHLQSVWPDSHSKSPKTYLSARAAKTKLRFHKSNFPTQQNCFSKNSCR